MAGINEMGLVVVSASSPHRQAERLAMPAVKGLNRRLLTACASVAEALAHPDWLLGPRQMLLADRTTIALVEVGEDGVHGVRTTADGTLAVTNHYTLPETVRFNPNGEGEERGAGSRERLARIQAFLAGRLAFTLADFLAIAASREGGPDRAIFRTGHTPTSRRTLATFAVHQGPKAANSASSSWIRRPRRLPRGTLEPGRTVRGRPLSPPPGAPASGFASLRPAPRSPERDFRCPPAWAPREHLSLTGGAGFDI